MENINERIHFNNNIKNYVIRQFIICMMDLRISSKYKKVLRDETKVYLNYLQKENEFLNKIAYYEENNILNIIDETAEYNFDRYEYILDVIKNEKDLSNLIKYSINTDFSLSQILAYFKQQNIYNEGFLNYINNNIYYSSNKSGIYLQYNNDLLTSFVIILPIISDEKTFYITMHNYIKAYELYNHLNESYYLDKSSDIFADHLEKNYRITNKL